MRKLHEAGEKNCTGRSIHFLLCKLPTLRYIAHMTEDVLSKHMIFLLHVVVMTLVLNFGKPVAAGGFLSVVEDLPLMDGLAEVEGSAMNFSTPQGRIVEVSATSISGNTLGRENVLAFYEHTLPQLGWTPAEALNWIRENERLGLTVTVNGGKLIVQFSLTPN
jgi:hypothetical protein